MEPTAESRPLLTTQAFAAAFNHLLQSQPWSQERLQRHAGKTLQLNLPPLQLLISIEENGMIAASPEGTTHDASLAVSPLALLHILSSRHTPQELVHTTGDASLAVDFGNIMQNLRWEAEEDLSKVFGDVLGHRMAQTGSGLLSGVQQAATSFAANLVEYWTEEKPLLAKRADIARFVGDVDAARDATERLEKRVERLCRPA